MVQPLSPKSKMHHWLLGIELWHEINAALGMAILPLKWHQKVMSFS